MHHAEAAGLAARLPALRLAALRVADSVAAGRHGRRRAGSGYDFWQYRTYEPGDPARLIDWRRSARGDRVYVREREAEIAQSVFLWCDRSPSMVFRSRRDVPEKIDRVALVLLALAALLFGRRGDGEQVLLLGHERRPFTGVGALERLTAVLSRLPVGTGGLPVPEELPRHSQLVLIGDFLDPVEDVVARIRAFAGAGVRGHLLQVLDPAEESLPMHGRTLFQDPEHDTDLLIRNVDGVRQAYVDRLAAHREAIRAACVRAGWTFDLHHTDRPASAALLALNATLERPVDGFTHA